MLGTKLRRSFGRAANALDYWAISLASVLVMCCWDRHTHGRKERFILAHRSWSIHSTTGNAWRQVFDVTGHIVSRARKQRDTGAQLENFLFSLTEWVFLPQPNVEKSLIDMSVYSRSCQVGNQYKPSCLTRETCFILFTESSEAYCCALLACSCSHHCLIRKTHNTHCHSPLRQSL